MDVVKRRSEPCQTQSFKSETKLNQVFKSLNVLKKQYELVLPNIGCTGGSMNGLRIAGIVGTGRGREAGAWIGPVINSLDCICGVGDSLLLLLADGDGAAKINKLGQFIKL